MATPSRRPLSPSRVLARDVLAISLHDSQGGDAAPPEWVHLIPAGVFSGRDGRGPYHLDAAAVLAAFAAHGADLPIDYEHQSLSAADKAGPVPAAGWITALEMREDGLWARVAWTPQAAELLAGRQYRYLSPVFMHRKDGTVVELLGAGLTHTPNLHLRAAAARHLETHTVEDLIERLIMMLNLPTASTPEDVVAELQKLIDRLTAAEAAVAQSRQIDPTQWVPMSQHRPVAEQLAALRAELAAGDIVGALLRHADAVIAATAIGARVDRAWLEAQTPDVLVELASRVLEVNADFFVQRVMPALTAASERIARIASGGMPGSPGSSAPGSAIGT